MWQMWVLYALAAVERTAQQMVQTVDAFKVALQGTKHRIRADYRFHSQDLINNLFTHPYTKIEFVERDLKVSRLTATKYLEALVGRRFTAESEGGSLERPHQPGAECDLDAGGVGRWSGPLMQQTGRGGV